MGKYGKPWEPETIVCAVDGYWKEAKNKTKQTNKQKTHQEEAGTLTQFKPCKSERRYEALKYLTPKM